MHVSMVIYVVIVICVKKLVLTEITNMFQMAANHYNELIKLPLPLDDHQILQRRQLIRQELTQKVNQLRLETLRRIFRIKCPCPLESVLGFFSYSSHIYIWGSIFICIVLNV